MLRLPLGSLLAVATAIGSAAPAGAGERLPPRPERSEAERDEHLKQLRAWYEAPPANWPKPVLDSEVDHRELGLVPKVSHPEDNPADPAKVALGKQLFFDPRLSGSGQIACASCHDPDLGWADGRTTSFGHNRRKLRRNSPSILNSGHRKALFWDGRAGSLEEQAAAVLNNQDEMHSADEVLVENLAAIPEYVESFKRLFDVKEPGIEQVAKAIAAFERTVVSRGTRFDSFLRGRHKALSDQELAGLHLFRTDARCLNCHNGPLLTDDKFHAIGLGMYGRKGEDLGRYAVTGRTEDLGAFRTPSLRDVDRTRPYMHSGLFDMDEILRLYNAGMPTERRRATDTRDIPPPKKSPLIKPLGLNKQDLADLAAFLGTLTESNSRVSPPRLPAGL
ncbi:Cytochrome c551 peroxidase precursor [Planctomycetes bacterium MalM25]|nr:Cytochrome c551 peroxidase precursor [Planctomycetes bacterium MalM25]